MPKFSYKAINESGSTVSGVIDAESLESANNILASKGYIPSKVKENRRASSEDASQMSIEERLAFVRPWELILFTKQFRTLIRAGIPMMTILHVLENQTENLKLKKIITLIAKDINGGLGIYQAFRKHPNIFSPLYCSVIQAGEISGELPKVLDRLTYIMEHEYKIKSDIKAALRYPLFVTFFLGFAFIVMLTFVIPTYVKVFQKAGISLPLPTQICILMYQFLSNFWHIIIVSIIGAGIALFIFLKTERGQYVKDFIFMKIPILGVLFVKAAMSRFASIFAILQSSGIAILDSITILAGTIGNAAISREFDHIRSRIEKGSGISAPLKSAKYFTPMVVNMVAIGEESGNLDEMLKEITEHYDVEVEYAMKRVSELVGPLLTIGLAAVVGFFALAIFLPMWDLTKTVK